MDRDIDTETKQWQDFKAKVRSGFDDAEWTSKADWKRANNFDSQVRNCSRKFKFVQRFQENS